MIVNKSLFAVFTFIIIIFLAIAVNAFLITPNHTNATTNGTFYNYTTQSDTKNEHHGHTESHEGESIDSEPDSSKISDTPSIDERPHIIEGGIR
ncbi:MAG: hypothetical protein WBZ20_19595 [Nitrososphaeraceae archaeon]